jgi:hypothetical protein
MEGFEKLSEMEPSILKLKSDDEITLFSKLDEAGFIVNMLEANELKG